MTIDPVKQPALRVVLYYSSGLIIADRFCIPLVPLCIVLLLFFLASILLKNKTIQNLSLIACLLLSAMLRFALAEEIHHNKCHANFDDQEIVITILSQKTTPFYVNSYIVQSDKHSGKIKGTLYARKNMPILIPGKYYKVSTLSTKAIESPKNPYVFNYQQYAKVKGLTHTFKCGKMAHFEDLGIKNMIRYKAFMIRSDISTRYLSTLGIEKGSLVNGLLLGLKSEIPVNIADLFKKLGVSHLLAVSGLHVGLIMMIVYQLLQILSLKRIPRVLIIIAFLIFYSVLTGGSASVVRSSLMSSMLLFAPVLKRRYQAMNAVAATALILLLINPYALKDVGFQFSFSAVFGILIAYPKLKTLIDMQGKSSLLKYMWDMLAVSISAALFTAPVAMFYFNNLQLASMLLNCLVIPLTFVVMICAIICLPCLYLPSFISDLFLHALDLSLDVFRFVLRLASRSGMWTLGVSSYWKALFLGIFVIFLLLFILEKRKQKNIGVMICLLFFTLMFIARSRDELIILALEKGKSAIYRKGREALLINTGAVKFGSNDYERNIRPIFEHFGIQNVEVVITEINKNKTGNIFRVKQEFGDCPLYLPKAISGLEGRYDIVKKDSSIEFAGKSIRLQVHEEKMTLILPFAGENLVLQSDSTEQFPRINIDVFREKALHLRSYGKNLKEMD